MAANHFIILENSINKHTLTKFQLDKFVRVFF